MIYLTGAPRMDEVDGLASRGFGLMLTPLAGARPELISRVSAFACDTGCYQQGDAFNLDRYFDWLERMGGRETCLFATAPDVVGDAAATLARSSPVMPELRRRGWPVAFVAQDGLEHLPVPWAEFDALFIGGSTDWKLGAAARSLVAEARTYGKHVHMGRVNSGKRLLYAKRIGCDSADGTYMAFNPSEAIDRMGRWLGRANAPQLRLFD